LVAAAGGGLRQVVYRHLDLAEQEVGQRVHGVPRCPRGGRDLAVEVVHADEVLSRVEDVEVVVPELEPRLHGVGALHPGERRSTLVVVVHLPPVGVLVRAQVLVAGDDEVRGRVKRGALDAQGARHVEAQAGGQDPGVVAPVVSVTVPESEAVSVWPSPARARRTQKMVVDSRRTVFGSRFVENPLDFAAA
jgi:hypothetical protein